MREFLVREWDAEVCTGYEADDGIGMAVTADSIICSIDKDFRQIPGQHYNFVKDVFEEVDSYSAALAFWTQMLVGDASDNVPGIAGIGPVKAARILAGLSPEEMEARTYDIYADSEWFNLNLRLLRIIRTEEEWKAIETSVGQGQGQEPATDSSEEDLSPFSTVNS